MYGGSLIFQMTEDKWIGSVNIILQPDTSMKTHLVVYIVDLSFSLAHTRYLPDLTIRVTRRASYMKQEQFNLHENVGFCWIHAVVSVLFVFVLFLVSVWFPLWVSLTHYHIIYVYVPQNYRVSFRHGRHVNFYNLYSPLGKQNKRVKYFWILYITHCHFGFYLTLLFFLHYYFLCFLKYLYRLHLFPW